MPCQVNWETRGVYQRLHGFVSVAEYRQSILAIQSAREFDELHYVIVDCLDLGGDDFTDENMAETAVFGHVAHLSNVHSPVAFVTTSPRLAGFFQRHFVEALREVMDIAVCETVAEARAWLASVSPNLRVLRRHGY